MPVLGIDVGSSTSTVATISRGAIDIVLNDVSQRYTPTCVSYGELQRVFGDQANTQIVSNFKNTCRGFLNVLGLNLNAEKDDNWTLTELDNFFSSTPFVLDDKGHLSYQVTNSGKSQPVSALSALVGYLNFLTDLAEKYTGGVCREVVMSYPSWFSEYQKALLAVSVRACGSKCLRLVSEGFAMAMDYGMYRLKQLNDETATTVALVNVGHSHTTVALVDFFASYCVILAELSDRDLGGRYLEYMLMNEMSKEFTRKHNLDPLSNTKTRLKVEAVASKVKRVLSANSDSSYSLECLMEDFDLTGNVKREEFEVMCSKEFLPRLSELLVCVLKMSGRSLESIHSVEVVGGITRVPCVQALISHAFNKPLSKTLNADESVARGCVLQGAISSKHYMVRKYNVIEKLSRPLTVTCLPGLGPFSQEQLFNSEIVTVANVGSSCSDVFKLHVKFEPPFTVLASFDDPRISSKNQLPTFQYTLSPQIPTASPKRENGTEEEEKPADEVEEFLTKVENEMKQEEAEEGWVLFFQFDDTGNLVSYSKGLDVCMVTPFKVDLEKLATAESSQRHRDFHETNRLKMLNDLETLVYSMRDKLQTSHREFVDPKTLPQLTSLLDETEGWLYENRGASLENLEKKFKALNSKFEEVEKNFRVYESKQNMPTFFNLLKQLADFSQGSDPAWLNVPENERQEMRNRLDRFNKESLELVEREKNLPKYSKPLFTMEQLEQELKKMKEEVDNLCKKHKVQPEAKEREEPQVEEPAEETEKKEQESEMEMDEENVGK